MADAQPSLRILLIEDDEDDVLITRELLEDGLTVPFSLEWAKDYETGFKAILENRHEVALIDLLLGPDSGVELIRQVQKANIATPLILLTGQGNAQLDFQAIELGASDYLVKGLLDAHSLVRAIRYSMDRANSLKRLASSETRYRLLFDANPEPLILLDHDSQRILSANQAAVELYGYSAEHLKGLDLQALRAPASNNHDLNTRSPLDGHHTKSVANLEVHQSSDNRSLYVEVTKHPLVLDHRLMDLLMVVDVTSRILALRQAQESEQAYLQLLHDMHDAALLVDPSNQVHFANPAARSLFNSPAGEMPRSPVDKGFEFAGQRRECRLELDGPEVWVEIQGSRTHWGGKQMVLLILRDITRRVQTNEQLRLLQRSIEATSNGITIADARAPDLPLIYVNPAFERITGYSAEEIVGRNSRFLQWGHTDQPGIELIRSALKHHQDATAILRNFRKDGTPFWNELYLAPVPDENGEITHFIGIQNDISEKRNAENKLAYNASHDVLTGLPNRSLLEDRLRQACQLAQRYSHQLAVLYIDLDGFKPVNDTLGHQVGDRVLVEVAERLKCTVSEGDTVARLSADEYVIVVARLIKGEEILGVIERILNRIGESYEIDGHQLRLTASIGATLSEGQLEDPMQLIQQADLAMYQSKQGGRNTYRWYTSELNQDVSQRVRLRNELQRAIENNELLLHYQPLIDSRTGTAIGAEALVRWSHPDRGLIPPGNFISLAEDTGQIIALGQYALEQACHDNRRLHDQGFKDHMISVNVSPIQLAHTDFVEQVSQALNSSGLKPEFLELEVVESVLLYDTDQIVKTLHQLRGLGVSLAIDDFGTGFSSLSYIKKLPASIIKIDRAFIKDVIRDRTDAAITRGVISMAHHLGLAVVAEGVETEAQAAFLRKHGCDYLQGFYLAKPMPFNEFEQFLRGKNIEAQPQSAANESDTRQTLLMLDDEENILRALSRVLRRDGYRILTATNAKEAFRLLAENEVQVILSDQRMPEISGTEFLSQVKDIYPNTTRIVLSGYTDLKSITESINKGSIYKFLTKPWDDREIRENIRQAFRRHRMAQSLEANGQN